MLLRSRIFLFLSGLAITLVVGFFIWGLFLSSNNYNFVFNQVLGQINQIGARIFTADLSNRPIEDIATVDNSQEPAAETYAPEETQTEAVIAVPVVLTGEQTQDQLDDIQEKLDIIKQQVNELIVQQNHQDIQPDVLPDDKAKVDDQNKDQNNNQNQENNQITEDVPPPTTPPVSGGGGGGSVAITYPKILISEVQILPINQRFIELYNPNSTNVDLTGWYLQRKDANDTSWGSFVSSANFSGKTISAKGYFLISRSDATADIFFSTMTLTPNNSLALKSPDEKISDQMGFSTVDENKSIGRKSDEEDTDSDLADFESDTPTPKAQNIAYVVLPAPTPLQSNDATVTSSTYNVGPLVSGTGTISNVSFGIPKATFLNNLTFAAGALENTTSSSLGDPIVSNDTLVVVAQDGTTTATYTITVNPVVILPTITSYTFNGTAQNITVNPTVNHVQIDLIASENVNWMYVRVVNVSDPTIYKTFSSGSGCVDGTTSCSKTWDGSISHGTALTDGNYQIKVHIKDSANNEFEDYVAPYAIAVNTAVTQAPTLASIAITASATKLNYNVGDPLDITGLVVTGTYSDNSTQVEAITLADITGFDSSAPVTGQILSVTFNGQTTTYTINISAPNNTASQLKIKTPPQTISANAVSGIFTAESQNSAGQLANVLATTYVNLSSSSSTGLFSSQSASSCGNTWTATKSITIAKNSAHKYFCYKDSTPGTFAITVSDSVGVLLGDSQSIIITTSPTN